MFKALAKKMYSFYRVLDIRSKKMHMIPRITQIFSSLQGFWVLKPQNPKKIINRAIAESPKYFWINVLERNADFCRWG